MIGFQLIIFVICIYWLNRTFGRLPSLLAWPISLLGVIIHELSHLLLCILCRLRVRKVVLFNGQLSGVQGYVLFDVPEQGRFLRTRLFLVGVAPLLVGVFLAILFASISLELPLVQSVERDFNKAVYLSPVEYLGLFALVFVLSKAFPSAADFKVAFRGVVSLLACLVVLAALIRLVLGYASTGYVVSEYSPALFFLTAIVFIANLLGFAVIYCRQRFAAHRVY